MKRSVYMAFYALSTVVIITSCKSCGPDPVKLETNWKTVGGSPVVKVEIPANPDNGSPGFSKEIIPYVQSPAPSGNEPKKDEAGNIICTYYKNNSHIGDTTAVLYTPDNIFNQSVSAQVKSTASSGDADGDGFNDEAVKAAIKAAGYDPTVFTIIPQYDPVNGIVGVVAGQELIDPKAKLNPDGTFTNPNGHIVNPKATITYTVLPAGDTVYTPGANNKVLVPDLSKINFNKIPVVKGPKGICPDGFHIPSDGEWKQLELSYGMSWLDVNREGIENDRGANVGIRDKMVKNEGLKYAGYMSENKTFAQLGEADVFWTSTAGKDANNKEFVWIRYIDTLGHKGIIRKKHYEKSAFPVKCFQD